MLKLRCYWWKASNLDLKCLRLSEIHENQWKYLSKYCSPGRISHWSPPRTQCELPTKAAWFVAYAWRPLLNGGLNKRKALGTPPRAHIVARSFCIIARGGAPLALSAIHQAYALCAQLFGLAVVCARGSYETAVPLARQMNNKCHKLHSSMYTYVPVAIPPLSIPLSMPVCIWLSPLTMG